MHRRTFIAGAAATLAACNRGTGGSVGGHVFVANFDGRAIGVVDLAHLVAVRHIAIGEAPRLVITHPALSLVFAAAGDKLVQISADTLEVVKSVKLAAPARKPFTKTMLASGAIPM